MTEADKNLPNRTFELIERPKYPLKTGLVSVRLDQTGSHGDTFFVGSLNDIWALVSCVDPSNDGNLLVWITCVSELKFAEATTYRNVTSTFVEPTEVAPCFYFYGCSLGYVAMVQSFEIEPDDQNGLYIIGPDIQIGDLTDHAAIRDDSSIWYLVPKSVFRPFSEVVADCNRYLIADDPHPLIKRIDQTLTAFNLPEGWGDWD